MPTSNLLAGSSLTGLVLVSQQLTATTATTVYTVPANTTVKLATASLCNTTAAAVVITGFSLHQTGSAVDATHRVVSGLSLAANDTLGLNDLVGGALLGPGDYIVVQVATANAVDVVITGAVSS